MSIERKRGVVHLVHLLFGIMEVMDLEVSV